MKNTMDRKRVAVVLLAASLVFFAMGFFYPLLQSGYRIGPLVLKSDRVYLWTSFRFFFDRGEAFIGLLLLFFTLVFPILKYFFLIATLSGYRFRGHRVMSTVLELINKWAMLDVFVVAVLILNMKFDSDIIISRLDYGTTLFAISILLMMTCSLVTGHWLNKQDPLK